MENENTSSANISIPFKTIFFKSNLHKIVEFCCATICNNFLSFAVRVSNSNKLASSCGEKNYYDLF